MTEIMTTKVQPSRRLVVVHLGLFNRKDIIIGYLEWQWLTPGPSKVRWTVKG